MWRVLRRTLEPGILAHVDAGKTTLTERLLYAAGVIDEVGSVDKGTTRTDSLALEQQRGITIKSAVVSFPIDDVTVNLIDTPGHPDFIAEVERVLSVLDGCVLVLSAVEGVQPQTRILMRALQRLEVPTLLFVNKIDRGGAEPERVLDEIERRLTPEVVPMGSADGLGTRTASFAGFGPADGELVERARAGELHPVFFGSALTGAGVDEVMAGIAELLPAQAGDGDGPLSARVFKIERGPDGDRIAYTRVFSGAIGVRDRFDAGKVTALRVFADGDAVQRDAVQAGEIAKLWGLAEIEIGDWLGEPHGGVEQRLEEYVRLALQEGLFGWQVTDCVVTVTKIAYSLADGPPSRRGPMPTARDLKKLVPLVLVQALEQGGSVVCEPVFRIAVEVPTEAIGTMLAALGRLGAGTGTPSTRGELSVLEATLPASLVQELRRRLPGLTGGEGVLDSEFAGYQPVTGEPPVRRRLTPDPRNLDEYLGQVGR